MTGGTDECQAQWPRVNTMSWHLVMTERKKGEKAGWETDVGRHRPRQ